MCFIYTRIYIFILCLCGVQQGCGVEAIVYVAELRDDASNTIKGPTAVTVIERIRRVVADEFQVSRRGQTLQLSE